MQTKKFNTRQTYPTCPERPQKHISCKIIHDIMANTVEHYSIVTNPKEEKKNHETINVNPNKRFGSYPVRK